MTFDLDLFVAAPMWSVVDLCKKGDLCDIAMYYDISVSLSMHKVELREAVLADGRLGKVRGEEGKVSGTGKAGSLA